MIQLRAITPSNTVFASALAKKSHQRAETAETVVPLQKPQAEALPVFPVRPQHFAGQLAALRTPGLTRFAGQGMPPQGPNGVTPPSGSPVGSTIPVVDLAQFTQATTEAAKNRFARDLGQKLQRYGFIAIKNHGVDPQLIERHFALTEQVLNVPGQNRAEKDQQIRQRLTPYQIDEVGRQVGYYPSGERKPDGKGGYSAPDPKHMWQTQRAHNVYPAQPPEFAKVNYELFSRMQDVGMVLVDALARYMGKEAGQHLKDFATGRDSMMRSIHYPTLDQAEMQSVRQVNYGGQSHWVRTGEHRDLSLFTLLPEATCEGLQLLKDNRTEDPFDQSKAQEWMDVRSQAGYLIMNAGDTLRFMTEHLKDAQGKSLAIPSAWHRVVGDAEAVKRFDRYSIPFFFNGDLRKAMPDLANNGKPVVRPEPLYKNEPFDPALRMLFHRFNRSGTTSGMTFEQFFQDEQVRKGDTVKRVLAERNLSDAYHAGAV